MLQLSGLLIGFGVLFLIILFSVVCSRTCESLESQRSSKRLVRQRRHEESRRRTRREFGALANDRTDSTTRVVRVVHASSRADRSSSPVGYSCLECGAPVQEESSLTCPECGTKRIRCPICQRFIAAGQNLLMCPYCETPGHANELRMWIEKKGTCPYCARRISLQKLKPFSVI
jgi:DNA-directed RNA polymerase subunit RPC12/RpoP